MVLDRDEIPEERQVAKLLKQILDGVAFLHSLNVAHLDIKVSPFYQTTLLFLLSLMFAARLTSVANLAAPSQVRLLVC